MWTTSIERCFNISFMLFNSGWYHIWYIISYIIYYIIYHILYNNLRYDLVSFKRTDHKKWLKSPFRFTHQFFYQRWTTMRNNCRLRRWGIVQFRWWWKWWFLWTLPRRNWPRLRRFRIHHRSRNRWMQKCLCRRTKWVDQSFWARAASAHLRFRPSYL